MSGPVIIITRTKQLANQVLSEVVKMNGLLPDRIACWSDADHDMDLKEALAVGTITNPDVEEVVRDVFENDRNVIIGAVTDHGSVELLKFILRNRYPVKIIVDELAEAIHGKEGVELDDTLDKHNTLDIIYKLQKEGLIEKIFGFDAVWKTSAYRGMNDATLWGSKDPIVKHTQHEMTFEKNVLVPVNLYAVGINENDIGLDPSDSPQDRKRKIEMAVNIAIVEEELELLNSGQQTQAKILAFCSGTKAARKNKKKLDETFPGQLDLNEVVLASTNQGNRNHIQEKMASEDTTVGFVGNYDIWTKGIDVVDLTAVCLGYNRTPGDEKLTHIVGRVARRVRSERGLPIEQLVIKREGRFYVPFLLNEDEGGKKYQTIFNVYEKLYQSGIEVSVTLITGGTGDGTKKRKKKLFTVDSGILEIDPDFQESIEIMEAMKAHLIKRNNMELIMTKKDELNDLFDSFFGD